MVRVARGVAIERAKRAALVASAALRPLKTPQALPNKARTLPADEVFLCICQMSTYVKVTQCFLLAGRTSISAAPRHVKAGKNPGQRSAGYSDAVAARNKQMMTKEGGYSWSNCVIFARLHARH